MGMRIHGIIAHMKNVCSLKSINDIIKNQLNSTSNTNVH